MIRAAQANQVVEFFDTTPKCLLHSEQKEMKQGNESRTYKLRNEEMGDIRFLSCDDNFGFDTYSCSSQLLQKQEK